MSTTYYELINPSDKYTLRAPDAKTAILAAVILGEGRYGLTDENDEEVLPIFFIGGLDEWITDQFGCGLNSLFGDADKSALADCFDSFAICGLGDRRLWDMAVEAMDDSVKRQAWLDKWHDRKRSSMNDIGARARQWATNLRLRYATVQP